MPKANKRNLTPAQIAAKAKRDAEAYQKKKNESRAIRICKALETKGFLKLRLEEFGNGELSLDLLRQLAEKVPASDFNTLIQNPTAPTEEETFGDRRRQICELGRIERVEEDCRPRSIRRCRTSICWRLGRLNGRGGCRPHAAR